MKKTTLIFLFFFGFNFISNAQFKYADEFPVNFDIDNVTLGVDKNVVNVSKCFSTTNLEQNDGPHM